MSKNEHAVKLGQLGGKVGGKSRSPAKSKASRENGRKGGRTPELMKHALNLARACESSYDAEAWPADGTSHQEIAAANFRKWLAKQEGKEYAPRPTRRNRDD